MRRKTNFISAQGVRGLLVAVLFLGLSISHFSEVVAQENFREGEENTDLSAKKPMSGREQIQWVEKQIAEAEAVLNEVQAMLENARQEKDAIKITCLDDKSTQMSVSLDGAKERLELLRNAVDSQDKGAQDQQFTILKTYFQKIDGLKSESENCLGEADVVLGKTRTELLILEDMIAEDPSEDVFIDNLGLEQPTHMSAYY